MRWTKLQRPRSVLVLLVLGSGGQLGAVGAQELTEVISGCGGTTEFQLAWCQELALAVQAAQGGLGLAAAGGTDLPGSASTLGWRTKGSPRFAVSLRGALTRAPFPAVETTSDLPAGETTANLPSLLFSGTVGLFDGFFVGPTVGGVGSLDLTLSGHWISTPKDTGFRENVLGWGIGGRIGVLRESFSLPGISLSGFHRWLGDTDLWSVEEGDPVEAGFALEASSIRAVIGKDLWGIGFLGGAGWERYSGDATLLVTDREGGGGDTTGSGRIESDRHLLFLGASMTFLAFQISAEGGWADGFNPTLLRPGDGFDPSASSQFGSLAIRLTF